MEGLSYRRPAIVTGLFLAATLASVPFSIEIGRAGEAEYSFEDVAPQAGVLNGDHAHFGCSWIDYDDDGWEDLYLANDDRNTLYRNNGNGTFSDVTVETATGDPWVAMRNVFADYDNDGDQDFYSHNFVRSTLYKNESNVFRDVNVESGAGLSMPNGTGAAWGDYNRDGLLDLHATGFPGWNVLYRNNGNGTFTNVQNAANLPFAAEGMGNTWGDYDNDGDLDLAVAAVPASGDSNFLFRNNGNGTFTGVSASAGIVVEPGSSTSAVVFADYDNDTMLDVLITEVELGSRKSLPLRIYLFHNEGNGTFVDLTEEAGVMSPAAPENQPTFEFWDAGFADFDNDGDLDLYVGVKRGNNLFYRNNGNGTFSEIGTDLGLDFPGYLKGMCWGDYDNDGDLDLYVLQRNLGGHGTEPSFLMRNTNGSRNWLRIKLTGTESNRDAIGARVSVVAAGLDVQLREIDGGSGFFDQHSRIQHFGLGSATTADISIRWPNGQTQELVGVPSNQVLEVTEPEEEPEALLCPWDLDGNGFVGPRDRRVLMRAMGRRVTGPPDFNRDGRVGIVDLFVWTDHRGPCPE